MTVLTRSTRRGRTAAALGLSALLAAAAAGPAEPSGSAETRWSRPYFPVRWPSVKR